MTPKSPPPPLFRPTHTHTCRFEIVVIDEAAQAVELSTLIPLKYGCGVWPGERVPPLDHHYRDAPPPLHTPHAPRTTHSLCPWYDPGTDARVVC